MKACIVTTRYHLSMINDLVDQNNVQICAIIIDDRKVAIDSGCPAKLVFAYWNFRDVVQQMQPDYILFLSPSIGFILPFQTELKAINYPLTKICVMSDYVDKEAMELSALLHKFEENPMKYSIFATGNSYLYDGILPNEFELPLFNFAIGAQDFYYDFEIVKHILGVNSSDTNIFQRDRFYTPPPRKNKINFKYAIVGVSPYSLHNDLSKTTFSTFRLPKYFYALNDLHNFGIDIETVRSFFKPKALIDMQAREKTFNYDHQPFNSTITLETAVIAMSDVRKWNSKNYPDTVKENKQILNEYLRLLNSFGITPILVMPPMIKEYQDNFDPKKLDELFSYLNELYRYHSFIFVNCWATDIFNERDFKDSQHLNISGAHKFTKTLNDVIMQLEGLNQ